MNEQPIVSNNPHQPTQPQRRKRKRKPRSQRNGGQNNGENNGQPNGLNNGQSSSQNNGQNSRQNNGQNNHNDSRQNNRRNNRQRNRQNNGQNNPQNAGQNNGQNSRQNNGQNNRQSNGQNNGQASGNTRRRGKNKAKNRGQAQQYPAWYYRYLKYVKDGGYEDSLSIFDEDLSDLTSSADSVRELEEWDAWDCGACDSDQSECECDAPWIQPDMKRKNKDMFSQIRDLRNERKRELRDEASDEDEDSWDEEDEEDEDEGKEEEEKEEEDVVVDKSAVYEANRQELLNEIHEAVGRIAQEAGSSEAREVSNKILRKCDYILIPARKLWDKEHDAMTIFNSSLQLKFHSWSDLRKPSGARVMKLRARLDISETQLGPDIDDDDRWSVSTTFLGPDWRGVMSLSVQRGPHPDVLVRFHDRDYIEVKIHVNLVNESIHALDEDMGGPPLNEHGEEPPLEAWMNNDPNAFIPFWGIRSTFVRSHAHEVAWEKFTTLENVKKKKKKKPARVETKPEPPRTPWSPPSPKESYFELNHPMGAYYDRRYSEFF